MLQHFAVQRKLDDKKATKRHVTKRRIDVCKHWNAHYPDNEIRGLDIKKNCYRATHFKKGATGSWEHISADQYYSAVWGHRQS